MRKRLKCLLLSLLLLCGCNPGTSSFSSNASGSVADSSISTPQEHEMVEIEQYSELDYEKHYSGVNRRISVLLSRGENVWFKFMADFEESYCFIIGSGQPYFWSTSWELNGTSIAEFYVNDENNNKLYDNYDPQYHGFYDIHLKKNQTIYFNLSNPDLPYSDLFFVDVDTLSERGYPAHHTVEDNIPRHTHTYGFSFEPYDSKQHKSYCWKDEEYVLEDHRYGVDGTCLDCGYRNEA